MAKKTVTEILTRTAQLIQRSNQWTQGSYEDRTTDAQGKTRTCRCLAGAALVAAGLSAEVDGALNATNGTARVSRSLLKTVNANPTRYGASEGSNFSEVEDFNDFATVKHSDVVRAVRDTLARING